jgi:rhomboid family GlyGly-CTERM serine protease
VKSSVRTAAALAIACAVATFLFADPLELRIGASLGTQPWRVWTSHFVHASPTHFALDVGAGIALILFGASALSLFWIAPIVAISVSFLRPDLAVYVGLSGVLHAWFAQVAMQRSPWLLLLVVAKVAHELATGGTTMGNLSLGAVPVPEAHAVGLLVGWLSALAAPLATLQRKGKTQHAHSRLAAPRKHRAGSGPEF